MVPFISKNPIFNGVEIMKKKLFIFCIFASFSNHSFAQNLNQEKAKKMEGRKTGVYVQEGIFYKTGQEIKTELQNIRRSGDSAKSQERVVIDFSTANVPKVYSYLSDSEKILYIDFFNTEIKDKNPTLANSTFVDSINIYRWKDNKMSMEVKFKERVFCDLFYLDTPGRLVIDMRKGL
jgi:hypothetical protein